MQIFNQFTHPFHARYPLKTLDIVLRCDIVLAMKIVAQFIHERGPIVWVKDLTGLFGQLSARDEPVAPGIRVVVDDCLIKVKDEELFLGRNCQPSIGRGGHLNAQRCGAG